MNIWAKRTTDWLNYTNLSAAKVFTLKSKMSFPFFILKFWVPASSFFYEMKMSETRPLSRDKSVERVDQFFVQIQQRVPRGDFSVGQINWRSTLKLVVRQRAPHSRFAYAWGSGKPFAVILFSKCSVAHHIFSFFLHFNDLALAVQVRRQNCKSSALQFLESFLVFLDKSFIILFTFSWNLVFISKCWEQLWY